MVFFNFFKTKKEYIQYQCEVCNMCSIDKKIIKCCEHCNRRLVCKFCKYNKKHEFCNQCIEEMLEDDRRQREYFGLINIQDIAIEVINDDNIQLKAGEERKQKKINYYGVAGNHFNDRPIYY